MESTTPTDRGGRNSRPGWANGCLVLGAAAIGFFILITVISTLTTSTGGRRMHRSSPLSFGRRVGLIAIEGEITDAGEFLDELKRLKEDSRVAALVVRINSPGGEVVATQEIHHALVGFHEETGFPIVASLGSLAASGGYYAACSAQKIMSEPGTLTGSIGVILTFADASELLRKIGVHFEVVKSGPKKDVGAYWRPLTDEERTMLQGLVGDVYDQFTEAVADGRHLPLERVHELADGRIFSGRQAKDVGLVDTLGYQEDAVRLAARMAGLSQNTEPLSKHRFEPPLLGLVHRLGGRFATWMSASPRLEYR